MNIAVIGAGFVGAVQAAALASHGNRVICADINPDLITAYRRFSRGQGALPIHEADLDQLLMQGKEHLRFTTDPYYAIEQSDIVYSAVGTPPQNSSRFAPADMTFVYDVARTFGEVMQDGQYRVLINKSTVPVGTAKRVEDIVSELTTDEFGIVSNPEFLAEGTAVRDCVKPSRIVIGSNSTRAIRILRILYQPFIEKRDQIFVMDPESAELVKYSSNTMLATQVVLTNVLANLAERTGGDWNKIREAVAADPRIGSFLAQGLGYGGSCFRKDVSQLFHSLKESGAPEEDLAFVRASLEQNDYQKLQLNRKIAARYGDDLTGRTFSVWGLSFKAGTSDIRDAASLDVIPCLLKRGATVHAHDPVAIEEFRKELAKGDTPTKRLHYHSDQYDTLQDSHGHLVLVEWDQYKTPDLARIKQAMKTPFVLDGKGILPLEKMVELDIDYHAIGRPIKKPL